MRLRAEDPRVVAPRDDAAPLPPARDRLAVALELRDAVFDLLLAAFDWLEAELRAPPLLLPREVVLDRELAEREALLLLRPDLDGIAIPSSPVCCDVGA